MMTWVAEMNGPMTKPKKKKSTAKLFPLDKEDQKLFEKVIYLVEATYEEQHMLWEKYHYHVEPKHKCVKKWEQVMSGHMRQIGKVDERPICVSIGYAILNGKKVMFYEGCSELVDHSMIEKWLERYQGEAGCCNATNFHHCIQAVEA